VRANAPFTSTYLYADMRRLYVGSPGSTGQKASYANQRNGSRGEGPQPRQTWRPSHPSQVNLPIRTVSDLVFASGTVAGGGSTGSTHAMTSQTDRRSRVGQQTDRFGLTIARTPPSRGVPPLGGQKRHIAPGLPGVKGGRRGVGTPPGTPPYAWEGKSIGGGVAK